MFIASLISSLALLRASPKDLNILKVFIYPRAAEALYNLLVERGIIKPVAKHGQTYFCLIIMAVVLYNFSFESQNIGVSFAKSVERYSDMTAGERQMFDAFRMVKTNKIKAFYPNNKLI